MGFRADIESEPVSELELRDVIVVRPETVIRAAVATMRNHSLGCAVVVDFEVKPAGPPVAIFTEQSLINAVLQGASLDDCTVGDFAESNFVSVKQSDPIAHVWDSIQETGARFVCVTDDGGDLVGITGQRGVAEYVCDYYSQQVVVQRLGSTPWMTQREGA